LGTNGLNHGQQLRSLHVVGWTEEAGDFRACSHWCWRKSCW